MTYFRKISTSLALVSLIISASAPAVFADELTITNNGEKSVNTITNTNTCTVNVTQNSKTDAKVTVDASSNTGKVSVDNNTGTGDITISTGNATTLVSTTISGGSNTADVPSCCDCSNGPHTVDISWNGKKSVNTVTNSDTKSTTVNQRTRTQARVRVKKASAKTGNISSNGNTGAGNVGVTTGDAVTGVDTTVTGGDNTLTP